MANFAIIAAFAVIFLALGVFAQPWYFALGLVVLAMIAAGVYSVVSDPDASVPDHFDAVRRAAGVIALNGAAVFLCGLAIGPYLVDRTPTFSGPVALIAGAGAFVLLMISLRQHT